VNIALPSVSKHRRRLRFPSQALVAAAFLAPAVLLLAVFLLYPLVSSLRLSLLDWNGLGSNARFIGLANWAHLAHDTVFWQSLLNNVILAVTSVVIELPIALALAVLLEKAGRGSRVLKILYFLPLLMSSVAIGVLFKNIYDPNFGPASMRSRRTGSATRTCRSRRRSP
jgi:raffinose/stachyose/melibiose transport system permease protein